MWSLCGHRVVTVWSLCGHCVVTVFVDGRAVLGG